MGLFSNLFGGGDTSHNNMVSNMVSYLSSTTIDSVTTNQADCLSTVTGLSHKQSMLAPTTLPCSHA